VSAVEEQRTVAKRKCRTQWIRLKAICSVRTPHLWTSWFWWTTVHRVKSCFTEDLTFCSPPSHLLGPSNTNPSQHLWFFLTMALYKFIYLLSYLLIVTQVQFFHNPTKSSFLLVGVAIFFRTAVSQAAFVLPQSIKRLVKQPHHCSTSTFFRRQTCAWQQTSLCWRKHMLPTSCCDWLQQRLLMNIFRHVQ